LSTALALPPDPAPVAKVPKPKLTNSALLAGAGGILLIAPLAFGAVEPWSIFALETSSVLLLMVWGWRQMALQELDVSFQALYLPMSAFFSLALLQWVLGTTAYRLATYQHLLLYAAYGMVVFVTTQSLRRAAHFTWLAKVVTIYGAAVASFAVLQGIAPNGKLYWIFAADQGGALYGPYVNHNHYAGLMEMLMPFPLVLAASRFTEGNRRLAVMAVAALMAGSLFLSGSRGGMLAFVAQMAVLTVLLRRSRGGNWKQPLLLGSFLVVVIGFLLWLGGNELTRRLASIHTETQSEMSGGVRVTIDRDCFRMLRQKPILGWGLGTFPVVYPQFRSFYSTFFVNQAHNDYLQTLVETGLAGIGITIWFLVVVFRRAASKLQDWTETSTGTLTAAALLGCTGILVHSFLDFNLQIPANALMFFVLCGLAAAGPLQESKRRRVLRRHSLIVERAFPENPASESLK